MSEKMVIQSYKGPYTVEFSEAPIARLLGEFGAGSHFLIDARVAQLYAAHLGPILERSTTILIEATEQSKSLEGTIPVIQRLVAGQVRREHGLVAVGGGVIQDITCFIASTLLRGLPWHFVPTTLLAQADSCIGSKSSINLGATKNILGTFTPPRSVVVHAGFLDTLADEDLHSGVGEILKVHAIAGAVAFDRIAADFDRLFEDRGVLLGYVRTALQIKLPYIEEDEFDRGVRNIFNYGHSFGHAIESATEFAVPHGIAVTMGMDVANHVAVERGLLPPEHCSRMHRVLRRNAGRFLQTPIPIDSMLSALTKDKKNTSSMLRLILPVGADAPVQRVDVPPDESFRAQCIRSLEKIRA